MQGWGPDGWIAGTVMASTIGIHAYTLPANCGADTTLGLGAAKTAALHRICLLKKRHACASDEGSAIQV